MKILHVYRTYFPDPPGGAQEAIRQICLSTQNHGVENTVYTLSPNPVPKLIERPEATVVRNKAWAAPASCDLGSLRAIATFRELASQADIVHYLFPWPFMDILHEFAKSKPSILTYISDIVRQKWLYTAYKPMMWRTLIRMDAIVSNSPKYAQTSPILSHPDIHERVRQIPLGIDEKSYLTEPDHKIFSRLNIRAGEPFVLFIGVFRYYKGLNFLVDACTQIRGKVVFAGEGPESSALYTQAERLGLKNAIFAGKITDAEKIALIKGSVALVLPSHLRSEAYGMVLVEASMYAKPMVTCEIGTGTSFVNINEETGFVINPESSNDLAKAINKLLEDSDLAKRFGNVARQRYDNIFSGYSLGNAYTKLYEEVLANNRQK